MPRKATRSAQGGGSIRKRSDGRWEGRYTVGRDPGTGRQVQKSVYGATQADVRKKLQQATTAIDEGLYIEPSKLTVGKWLDIWLSEYTGDIKPRSIVTYKGHVENYLKPRLGAVKLSALTPQQIQRVYNSLLKGEDDKPGLAPKTIKNAHGVLHKALQQAVLIGYLKFNPSGACKLPRVEKPEINPLDEAQIAAFLDAIKGHQYERIYLTALFTGARQAEILGLTWDNVDFKNGTIYICQQLQLIEGVHQIGPPKNDKPRRIKPAPSVMKVLREQKALQAEWKLKAGQIWQDAAGLVFTNEIGKHRAAGPVYKSFKRIVKRIGVPDARFHDLRHTYAVLSLQGGDNIKTVQENLGHHTAAFTLDVYGHVSQRMQQDSAKRMERCIKRIKNL